MFGNKGMGKLLNTSLGYVKYAAYAGVLAAVGFGTYAAVASLARQAPYLPQAYGMVADIHPVAKASLDAALGLTVVGAVLGFAVKQKWVKRPTMNLGMAAFAGAFGMSLLTRPGMFTSGVVSNLSNANFMSAITRLVPGGWSGTKGIGLGNSHNLAQQGQNQQQQYANNLNQQAPNMGSNLFGTRRALRSSVNLF
jgi:hypothetical protein